MSVVYPQTETDIDVPMQRCTECNEYHPLDRFASESSWRGDKYVTYTRNQCKNCRLRIDRERKRKKPIQLKPLNKQPRGTPEQCGSCSTTTGNILGDVDIASARKYGYLCAKCYKLVRDFQSDAGRMRKVLEYVESTR
jgi:hypothetical protein